MTSIRISQIATLVGVVAAAGFVLPLLANASSLAPAPAPCAATSAPFLTFTQNISNDPDSSNYNGSTWALDTFTENVSVWVGSDGQTYCANATVNNGTFVTTGPNSPNAGATLAPGITGTMTGGENYTLPSSMTLDPSYSTTTVNNITLPANTCGGDGSGCASGAFSNWVADAFTNATTPYNQDVNTYWLSYTTPSNGSWIDSDAVSGGNNTGDITGNPSTVYVSTSGNDTTGNGTQSAPYATIQRASAEVAAGGTVSVAAGTYDAFTVSGVSGITITGAGEGQTIISPTTLISTGVNNKYDTNVLAAVFVNNSTGVTIQDMTIESTSATPGSGGANAIVFWNGSSGTIANSDVTGTYTIDGDQTGQGIAIDASTGTDTVALNDVNVSGFQKNGIQVLDGNGATSGATDTINVTVTGGSVTGAGATTQIAQNGIEAWNRGGGNVTVTVSGETVSNFDYSPAATPDDYASAILSVGGANMSVNNSTISNDPQYTVSTDGGTAPAIDAAKNYWGSASGPATSTLDSNVTYSPWWEDAGMTTLAYATSTSGSNTITTTGSSNETLSGTSTQDNSVNVTVVIPANTTITGNASWDGTIDPPTATTTSVSISGENTTVTSAVTIGSTESDLLFSNPVEITFAGEAGQHVGFYDTAGSFSEITEVCDGANTPTVGSNALSTTAPGEACKIDDGSGNLIVWTTHFSTFVTFTETAIPTTTTTTTTSGGGGNGPIAGGGGGGGSTATALPNNGSSGTSGSTGTTGTGTTGGGQVLGAAAYNFATNFGYGSTGEDVIQLQTILIADGYLHISAPTGWFGPLTKAAVEKYQAANGIVATGFVGPLTRAVLNQGVTPTSGDELQSLEQELQALESQIAALNASSTTSTSTATTTAQ